MEEWGKTKAQLLRIFRRENSKFNIIEASERRRRELLRLFRHAVCKIALIAFWCHLASAPDSKAAKRAAKRFKAASVQ
jgi:hypothetical protein